MTNTLWRLVLLCMLPVFSQAQQKAMLSQYMFNGLVANPAYSSIDDALNVTAISRHQWVGFEGAPNTQIFSFHTPIRESNSSFGMILMRDQIAEVIVDNAAYLTFAQRVQLGEESFLSLGVNAGVSKFNANYSEIPGGAAMLDPAFDNENDWRSSVGLGLMLFSPKFYAGISAPSFMEFKGNNRTKTAFRTHYILQGGYLVDLGESLKFKPNALIKYVNGSPMQMDLNANFLIAETFWLGSSWRSFDSFNFLAEVQVTPRFQVGYSYDLTTSRLAQVQKGSHEIMLSLRFANWDGLKCYF